MARRARDPWARDERGQMLILAGVVLVLGFVIVGSTLIELQSVGEETARLERESLLEELYLLLATYNETLRDNTDLGNVNVQDFESRLDRIDADVRNLTTKRGLVLEASRNPNGGAEYLRPSRCLQPTADQGGIVLGIEEVTFRETIVGVVYDLWITDGQETLRTTTYFRLFRCHTTLLYTPATVFQAGLSDLDPEPPSGFPAGVDAPGGPTASFVEALTSGAWVPQTLHGSSVLSNNNWDDADDALGPGDDDWAETATGGSNAFRVALANPSGASADTVGTVVLEVEAHIFPVRVNDNLRVRPVLAGVNGAWTTLVPPSAVDGLLTADVTAGRPGGGTWTFDDLVALEVEVEAVKVNNVDGTWRVDRVSAAVQTRPSQFNGHAVVDVVGVPDYARHWIVANVTLPADAEPVRLAVYDWVADGWDDLGVLPGGAFMAALTPADHIDANRNVRFRLLFDTPDDATRSTLIVDELRVKSTLT